MNACLACVRAAFLSLRFILAGAAQAAPTLWVADINRNLGKVDAATGSVQLVGFMGPLIYDLAFDPYGRLYGIDDSDLYRIDTATAAATLIGPVGATLNSLVFSPGGTLYGANTSLYTIDPATGAGTEVGNGGTSYYSSGDLAFVGDALYLSSTLPASDYLVRLDTTTGAANIIGPLGVSSIYGMATDDHATLYGVSESFVYTIDPASGATTLVSDYASQGLALAYGAAFLSKHTPPVPEPSAWMLLLGGVALCGAWRAQRSAASLQGRFRYTFRPTLQSFAH